MCIIELLFLIEIILSDIEQIEKRIVKLKKNSKGKKSQSLEISLLESLVKHLSQGKVIKDFKCTADEREIFPGTRRFLSDVPTAGS